MPLLEELTCEKDYLALYEKKDKRIIWDDNQSLYIASAYVNNHKLKEANQVIEKRFGKPGMRKQYKEVLSFWKFKNAEAFLNSASFIRIIFIYFHIIALK